MNPFRRLAAALFGTGNETASGLHPTAVCPKCGSRLARACEPGNPPSEPAWRCPNPDCPVQVRAALLHWASKEALDIPELDAEMISSLVGRGLARDVAELYRLKLKEIEALPGVNTETANRLFDNLTASLKREGWRLLYGLGIPNVSAETALSLCRHLGSVDGVFAAGKDRMLQAQGVDETAARSINQWHSDPINRRLVRRLFKAGLNFKQRQLF